MALIASPDWVGGNEAVEVFVADDGTSPAFVVVRTRESDDSPGVAGDLVVDEDFRCLQLFDVARLNHPMEVLELW